MPNGIINLIIDQRNLSSCFIIPHQNSFLSAYIYIYVQIEHTHTHFCTCVCLCM
ncbi:hypothetical protein E2320_002270 [Naja naja]|nr:hypothetical protein E2320_002270 [Naja naja]